LNTTPGGAANLIPDGTSVSMAFTGGVDQWFAARVEGSKSYVAEALLAGNDRTGNDISMTLYQNDGATAYNGYYDCSSETNSAAPSMQASDAGFVSYDGRRCSFYPPVTAPSLVLVRISSAYSGTLKVRLRETTYYSRWTVNGYNMYVPVHNPSQSTITGCVVYYTEAATGTDVSSYTTADCFTLGGYGSTQFMHPMGSLTPNRGQVRVVLSKGTDVQIQTYGFNPSTGTYLVFYPERLNHGSGGTW
jgi:hypothetical protein